MKNNVSICFYLFLILSLPCAHAKSRALVIGGSCEGNSSRNLFLKENLDISVGLKNNGWSVDVLFDGKSAHCSLPSTSPQCQGASYSIPESCCPKGFDLNERGVSAFVREGIVPKINSRKNLFESLMAVKDGEQFLLVINTHGLANPDGTGHQICMDQDDLLSVSHPGLINQLTRINKFAKIGVIDGSCYSGESASVFGTLGCTVTSQSPIQMSKGYSVIGAIAHTLQKKSLNNTPPWPVGSLTDVFSRSLYLSHTLNLAQMSGFSEGTTYSKALQVKWPDRPRNPLPTLSKEIYTSSDNGFKPASSLFSELSSQVSLDAQKESMSIFLSNNEWTTQKDTILDLSQLKNSSVILGEDAKDLALKYIEASARSNALMNSLAKRPWRMKYDFNSLSLNFPSQNQLVQSINESIKHWTDVNLMVSIPVGANRLVLPTLSMVVSDPQKLWADLAHMISIQVFHSNESNFKEKLEQTLREGYTQSQKGWSQDSVDQANRELQEIVKSRAELTEIDRLLRIKFETLKRYDQMAIFYAFYHHRDRLLNASENLLSKKELVHKNQLKRCEEFQLLDR